MDKVSIIIPCRNMNPQCIRCIRECLNLDYDNFEILVLPDFTDKKSKNPKLKIISTGKIKPALKRNIGMEKASGDFFAFIDDDAYPKKEWLKNAIKYFDDEKIGLVGGPNLTPPDVNFAEKVSGYVSSNFLTQGKASIRFKVSKNQFVKELPSCNYIARREISPKYYPNFLTAEDSKFCFDISKKGHKILYAKDVIVYHHRRDTLKKHLKQYFIYARDVAWLTKKEFSVDKMYFPLLSLCAIGFFVLLILSFFNNFIKNIFLLLVFLYLIIIFVTSIHENIKTSFFVFITTIGTHFTYGFGWLKGFFSSPEKTEIVV